jgi:5'-nucleotidase
MVKSVKPKILVTNDDGIDSPGIHALVIALKKVGDVVVVAPDRQQSAVGHALTVSKPLRVTPFHRDGQMWGYAINGTPSDCVKLAISSILGYKPDLVFSGINHGQNTSINIIYSGTVSAATEGMLLGISSVAVSVASYSYSAELEAASEYSAELAKKLLKHSLPNGTLLNVNVPAVLKSDVKGIRITRQSRSYWKDIYEKRTDPMGRDYYWFSGEYNVTDESNEADDVALNNGYISVTPLRLEFTDLGYFGDLKKILF